MTSTSRLSMLLTINLLLLIFDCGISYLPATTKGRLNPSHLNLQDTTSPNRCHSCATHHENNNIISFFGNAHSSRTSCGNIRGKRKKRSLFPSTTKESMLICLQSSDANDQEQEQKDDGPPEPNESKAVGEDLVEDDWKLLSEIVRQSESTNDDDDDDDKNGSTLEQILVANLPRISPRLALALRGAAADGDEEFSADVSSDQKTRLKTAGKVLVKVLEAELASAKELLLDLLDAGEVRKLDGKIGRALQDGKLDMAFFSVLNMNLGNAAEEERAKKEEAEASGEKVRSESAVVTTRYQILQHVYTRCQEEMEKSVGPGAGLLNKLLRTEMASIRQNQLKHYLVPEENSITSADGSEIKLVGAKALVTPEVFLEAIEDAVRQIRTVEKAGGADRSTAAGLVESCRQVAIEARSVILEGYGEDDEVFVNFQDGLQPVFRPTSAESEYIRGS